MTTGLRIVFSLLALPLILANSSLADGLDVDQFMLENGLRSFPLEKISARQHFDNPRYVVVTNGQLQIRKDGRNLNSMSFKEGNTLYEGTNNGEWGGVLEVTKDGVKQELMKGNIVHLLPIGDELYIIEGLAHLGMSGGSINVIPDRTNPTTPSRITLLPDAPILVYVDNSFRLSAHCNSRPK